MSDKPADPDRDRDPPADLSHAGAVVDKGIEYMVSQNIGSLAIASALLGGALGLLSRSMTDDSVVGILNNAIASVRAGDMRRMTEPPPESPPESPPGL